MPLERGFLVRSAEKGVYSDIWYFDPETAYPICQPGARNFFFVAKGASPQPTPVPTPDTSGISTVLSSEGLLGAGWPLVNMANLQIEFRGVEYTYADRSYSGGYVPIEELETLAIAYPVSDELESAAEDALKPIDSQNRTISGVAEAGINWSEVRERWRTVGLALITSARLRFDAELFDKRTEAIDPFVNDHPDVYQQPCQERCLRATYAIDFETLERLLDDWTVRESDPIWMIRKAVLLW